MYVCMYVCVCGGGGIIEGWWWLSPVFASCQSRQSRWSIDGRPSRVWFVRCDGNDLVPKSEVNAKSGLVSVRQG